MLTLVVLCSQTVTRPTSAIEIHADPEVIVQNGTTGILRCTFRSSEVVSSATTVTWNFQSSHPDSQYYKSPYVVSPRWLCQLWEDFPQFLRMFSCDCFICRDTRRTDSAVPWGMGESTLLWFGFWFLIFFFFFSKNISGTVILSPCTVFTYLHICFYRIFPFAFICLCSAAILLEHRNWIPWYAFIFFFSSYSTLST